MDNASSSFLFDAILPGRVLFRFRFFLQKVENCFFNRIFLAYRKLTLKNHSSYLPGFSDGLCHELILPAPRIAPVRPDLSHSTAKNWEIPREELEVRHWLGAGGFGEVWYGELSSSRIDKIKHIFWIKFKSRQFPGVWCGVVEVAIKSMNYNAMSKEAFLEEAEIMKKINHPNIG